MAIIKLKTDISIKQGVSLRKEIERFITKKNKVPCKGLNRRAVFFDKIP